MKPTEFQELVQSELRKGKSLLVVAPTGLGKTFAVAGDLADKQETAPKIIYSVPLRALGYGIRDSIQGFSPHQIAIHHGDQQDSMLFSERVVVTTFDQIVCGTPGLPLSFSLKAGHAIAGALMMSRLVLDEVHLAWSISRDSLSILLGIMAFRQRLGLQTVVVTATLPDAVRKVLKSSGLFDRIIVVGDDCPDDERLLQREKNRKVSVGFLDLKTETSGSGKRPDLAKLVQQLSSCPMKVIYFGNTVERLQSVYDKLREAGVDAGQLIVLHNRMPRKLRTAAEKLTKTHFGNSAAEAKFILLTNQVAEAGLDISAPAVFTDPAPVDTLVQRAGRCARWFDKSDAKGCLTILKATKEMMQALAGPYSVASVEMAVKECDFKKTLTWEAERSWVDAAWGGGPKKSGDEVQRALDEAEFALNLFDRAAQNRSPGQIANAFREILSIEVGVMSNAETAEQHRQQGRFPLTSSISLAAASYLWNQHRAVAKLLRNRDGSIRIEGSSASVELGDVLLLPDSVAHVHFQKGLCYEGRDAAPDGEALPDEDLWVDTSEKVQRVLGTGGNPQSLLQHTVGVMGRTRNRLHADDSLGYRQTLCRVLKKLEPTKDADHLADAIADLAELAAGLHDIGKGSIAWQESARELAPDACPSDLIGRTGTRGGSIGVPHTPPAFAAVVKAAELLLGGLGSFAPLVRAIALAAARHHSALLNPATLKKYYEFKPELKLHEFVQAILRKCSGPESHAPAIIEAACSLPEREHVPLMLPNDDLFPIYALIGRAILMSDREDAAGRDLESR